jgi:hypothetical protein
MYHDISKFVLIYRSAFAGVPHGVTLFWDCPSPPNIWNCSVCWKQFSYLPTTLFVQLSHFSRCGFCECNYQAGFSLLSRRFVEIWGWGFLGKLQRKLGFLKLLHCFGNTLLSRADIAKSASSNVYQQYHRLWCCFLPLGRRDVQMRFDRHCCCYIAVANNAFRMETVKWCHIASSSQTRDLIPWFRKLGDTDSDVLLDLVPFGRWDWNSNDIWSERFGHTPLCKRINF